MSKPESMSLYGGKTFFVVLPGQHKRTKADRSAAARKAAETRKRKKEEDHKLQEEHEVEEEHEKVQEEEGHKEPEHEKEHKQYEKPQQRKGKQQKKAAAPRGKKRRTSKDSDQTTEAAAGADAPSPEAEGAAATVRGAAKAAAQPTEGAKQRTDDKLEPMETVAEQEGAGAAADEPALADTGEERAEAAGLAGVAADAPGEGASAVKASGDKEIVDDPSATKGADAADTTADEDVEGLKSLTGDFELPALEV
jgi:membrane protein involved in colicin uptake